jgi:AcrR family transcriptional regulator
MAILHEQLPYTGHTFVSGQCSPGSPGQPDDDRRFVRFRTGGGRLSGKEEAGLEAGKVDRRVQRTRKLLREALVSLIREKGFEALSVQDIVDRADVGRATFYAHFDNKEDLLVSGLEDVGASLAALQRQAHARGGSAEERLFAFSRELFAHTNEHRDVFEAMVGDRSVAILRQVFHRMLVQLMKDEVKALRPRTASGARSAEPVAQFAAGALFGLLMWWLEGRSRPGVDEVNALFRRLAIPALTASLR